MARPGAPVTIIQPDDLADDEWDRIMAADTLSAAPAPAIGYHVSDASGVLWEVWDSRPTAHDFAVYLGRPIPITGPGGGAVILTAELTQYLVRHRRSPDLIELPISATTIHRLRRTLGHNWYEDGERWWLRRMHDLETLTTADFAVRHAVKVEAVTYARLNLLGPRQRPAGWWHDPTTADLILSAQPRIYVAQMLDICASTVGRYRTMLRQMTGEPMDDASIRERIRQAKIGRPAHPNTRAALLDSARAPKSSEWRSALSERNRDRGRPDSWYEKEWTPEQDAQLGTAPDRIVSDRIGRSINAVRCRRQALRIAAYKP